MRNPFDRDLKMAELEPTEYFKRLRGHRSGRRPGPARADTAAPALAAAPRVLPPADTIGAVRKGHADRLQQLRLQGHVRGQASRRTRWSHGCPKIADNLDENGKYKVNKYKLNFTPDIIYGNAGYDTFYGVTGSTIMAFSDLLGDHQIVFCDEPYAGPEEQRLRAAVLLSSEPDRLRLRRVSQRPISSG